MTCPQEPVPAGWRLWRGSVPAPLGQFAVDVRDHIGRYAYGAIAEKLAWQGSEVGAFKSHHTWTYRGGTLVRGLCIPGIALVVPADSPLGTGAAAAANDLTTPDPNLAVYGAPEQTNWALVGVAGGAIALVTAGFVLGLKLAERR